MHVYGLPCDVEALETACREYGATLVHYPVLLPDKDCPLRVLAALELRDIRPRRYFYPALNTLDYLRPEWASTAPWRRMPQNACLPAPVRGMQGEVWNEQFKRSNPVNLLGFSA